MRSRGERVRAHRQRLGLTQGEVAERIEAGRTTVVNIEAGKQGITLDHAIALADLFDVSLDALVGRDPQADPDLDWYELGYLRGFAEGGADVRARVRVALEEQQPSGALGYAP